MWLTIGIIGWLILGRLSIWWMDNQSFRLFKHKDTAYIGRCLAIIFWPFVVFVVALDEKWVIDFLKKVRKFLLGGP